MNRKLSTSYVERNFLQEEQNKQYEELVSPDESDGADGYRMDEILQNEPHSNVDEYPLTDKTYEQDHGLASGFKSGQRTVQPELPSNLNPATQKARLIIVEEEDTPPMGVGEEEHNPIAVNSSAVQSRQ